MSHTITVRLTKELAAWVEQTAASTGVSQGQLIREQLEKARSGSTTKSFMRFAGALRSLPKDLSKRKGFSTK
jgi:Ribbon-helix-helix protein, copG family